MISNILLQLYALLRPSVWLLNCNDCCSVLGVCSTAPQHLAVDRFLKGAVSRDFLPPVFSSSNTISFPDARVNPWICRDFRLWNHWNRPTAVSGVIDTAHRRSAVSLTPLTRKLAVTVSDISANSNPYSKKLYLETQPDMLAVSLIYQRNFKPGL
jgi:hypothetical protein